MTFPRLRRAALCGTALFILTSCGEPSPVGVEAPPSRDLLGDSLSLPNLLSCTPLDYDSTSQVIGPWGGTISAGPHSLYIPPGALTTWVTITAVVRPDTVNAIQFEPEGLQFNKTAYLNMSYANCSLLGSLVPKQIAFTTDSLDILELLTSWDNLFAQRVTGQLHHFSEYAVAW